MKSQLIFLLACSLFTTLLVADDEVKIVAKGANIHPSQAILLKLPNNSYENWQELDHHITKSGEVIELIPKDKTSDNWSEIIVLQFLNSLPRETIGEAVEIIRLDTFNSYPHSKVVWKVIEKNKNDMIYECKLQKPYKEIGIQHQITRAFLTESGLHLVGFARRHAFMGSDERKKWLKILKEMTSIVSYDEATNSTDALSIAKNSKNLPSWEGSKVIVRRYAPELVEQYPQLDEFPEAWGGHRYFLELTGFPIERTMKLYTKRLLQEGEDWWYNGKLLIKEDGSCLFNDHPYKQYVYLSSENYLPGERVHCCMETLEKDFSYEFSLIPHPMELKNRKDQLIIEAELQMTKPSLYTIRLHGFKTDEDILLSYQSGDEKSPPLLAKPDGILYSPDLIGKTGGHGHLKVTRMNGESYKMSFPWGTTLLEHMKKNYVP